MLLDTQRAAVFIIVTSKVLLIETQHHLIRVVKPNIGLEHEHVLITANVVSYQLGRQQGLNRRRLRREVRRIDYVRYRRPLPVEGPEKKRAIFLDWAAHSPTELIDL